MILQKITRKTQGIFAWIIFIGIALSFTVFGFGTNLISLFSGTSQTTAAKIGKNVLSWDAIDQFLRNQFSESEDPSHFEKLSDYDKNRFRQQARDILVNQLVLLEWFKRVDFTVSEPEVATAIQELPMFQDEKTGRCSKAKYEQILKASERWTLQFHEEVRDGLLSKNFQARLAQTEFLSPEFQNWPYSVSAHTRDAEILFIPNSRFEKSIQSQLTDAEVEKYYAAQIANYQTTPQIKLSYIEWRDPSHTPDNILETDPAKSPDTGADLESDTPESVIESDLNTATDADLEDVVAFSQLDQLANLAFESPGDLNLISKQFQVPIQETEWFEPTGTDSGLPSHEKIVELAFQPEFIELRENSEPIKIGPNQYVVFRVLDYEPAIQQPLEIVKPKVLQKLMDEKSDAAAMQFASQQHQLILNARQSQPDQLSTARKEVLKNLNIFKSRSNTRPAQWFKSLAAIRQDKDLDPNVVGVLFELDLKNQPFGVCRLYDETGYAVVELKAVHLANATQMDQAMKKQVFDEQLQNSRNQLFELLLLKAKQEIPVKLLALPKIVT